MDDNSATGDDANTVNLTVAGGNCPNGERKISWNAAGPRGATGRRGARGFTGAAGPAGAVGATGPKGDAGSGRRIGRYRWIAGTCRTQGRHRATGTAGSPGPAGPTGNTGPPGMRGPIGLTGPAGAAAVSNFAEFYALMPPDNAAPVMPGSDVSFPQDGPSNNTIIRTDAYDFRLPTVGTYRVAFNVPIQQPGQLVITLNDIELAYTVTGRATGTTSIAGEALVTTVRATRS